MYFIECLRTDWIVFTLIERANREHVTPFLCSCIHRRRNSRRGNPPVSVRRDVVTRPQPQDVGLGRRGPARNGSVLGGPRNGGCETKRGSRASQKPIPAFARLAPRPSPPPRARISPLRPSLSPSKPSSRAAAPTRLPTVWPTDVPSGECTTYETPTRLCGILADAAAGRVWKGTETRCARTPRIGAGSARFLRDSTPRLGHGRPKGPLSSLFRNREAGSIVEIFVPVFDAPQTVAPSEGPNEGLFSSATSSKNRDASWLVHWPDAMSSMEN